MPEYRFTEVEGKTILDTLGRSNPITSDGRQCSIRLRWVMGTRGVQKTTSWRCAPSSRPRLNELCQAIHDRMPVILASENYGRCRARDRWAAAQCAAASFHGQGCLVARLTHLPETGST